MLCHTQDAFHDSHAYSDAQVWCTLLLTTIQSYNHWLATVIQSGLFREIGEPRAKAIMGPLPVWTYSLTHLSIFINYYFCGSPRAWG